MLGKLHNRNATEYQTTFSLYLLAAGASRSLFDVLNHASISLSYSHAVNKLRQLGEERLLKTRKIARSQAFMLIWDNINIAFRVHEQRDSSKSHFDNGTTATLVPLHRVAYGALSLAMLPPRRFRLPYLSFNYCDLLPTRDEALRMHENIIWHVQDILYNTFPSLRARFGPDIPSCPPVHAIPPHQTQPYPLPAMHIDESTLDGTFNVLTTILQSVLKLTDADLEQHGIIICAGDHLTVSLLDKV